MLRAIILSTCISLQVAEFPLPSPLVFFASPVTRVVIGRIPDPKKDIFGKRCWPSSTAVVEEAVWTLPFVVLLMLEERVEVAVREIPDREEVEVRVGRSAAPGLLLKAVFISGILPSSSAIFLVKAATPSKFSSFSS